MSGKDCFTQEERAEWDRASRVFDKAMSESSLIFLVAKREQRRLTDAEWSRHDELEKEYFAAFQEQAAILDRAATRDRKEVDRFYKIMERTKQG
jgi:hypothetical protein